MKADNNFHGAARQKFRPDRLTVGERAIIDGDALEKRQHPSAATGPLD
jgi:hypothetical protein